MFRRPLAREQWWELYDVNTQRHYYHNVRSGKTEWHRPSSGDVIPLSNLQVCLIFILIQEIYLSVASRSLYFKFWLIFCSSVAYFATKSQHSIFLAHVSYYCLHSEHVKRHHLLASHAWTCQSNGLAVYFSSVSRSFLF